MTYLSQEQHEALREMIKICREARQFLSGSTEDPTKTVANPDPFIAMVSLPVVNLNPYPSITLISSPQPIKPPDPTDFNPSDPISAVKALPQSNLSLKTSTHKLQRRYSCEDIHERMENGLCVFCDEPDIPGHQLKHMSSHIIMVEYEDGQLFDDDNKWVEPVVELDSSFHKTEPSVIKDVISTDMIQDKKLSSEDESQSEVLHQIKSGCSKQWIATETPISEITPIQNHEGEYSMNADSMVGQKELLNIRKKKRRWSKSWQFRFKSKSEMHKSRGNIILLMKQGAVNLPKAMFMGLDEDNQIFLDGIAKNVEINSTVEEESWDFYDSNKLQLICSNHQIFGCSSLVCSNDVLRLLVGASNFGAKVCEIFDQNAIPNDQNKKLRMIIRSLRKRIKSSITILRNEKWLNVVSLLHSMGISLWILVKMKPKIKKEERYKYIRLQFAFSMYFDRKTTHLDGNVVKWKHWLVISLLGFKNLEIYAASNLLYFWFDWKEVIKWVELCFLQNDVHMLLTVRIKLQEINLWFWSFREQIVVVYDAKRKRSKKKENDKVAMMLVTIAEVLALFTNPHILVVGKNETEISFICCYGSYSGLGFTVNIIAGTFMDASQTNMTNHMQNLALENVVQGFTNPVQTMLAHTTHIVKELQYSPFPSVQFMPLRSNDSSLGVQDNFIAETFKSILSLRQLKFALKFIYSSLLRPPNFYSEARFLTQNNDLEQPCTELQRSSGLNFCTCLIIRWNQTLYCDREAGYISYGTLSIANIIVGFHTTAIAVFVLEICVFFKIETDFFEALLIFESAIGEKLIEETYKKLATNAQEYWFYSKPMIKERLNLTKKFYSFKEYEDVENSSAAFGVYEVFHLQRPPELIELHGYQDFLIKYLKLSSLRTRMLSTREYCNRNSGLLISFRFSILVMLIWFY